MNKDFIVERFLEEYLEVGVFISPSVIYADLHAALTRMEEAGKVQRRPNFFPAFALPEPDYDRGDGWGDGHPMDFGDS